MWRIFSPGHGGFNGSTKGQAVRKWVSDHGIIDRLVRIGKILTPGEAAAEETEREFSARREARNHELL